MSGFTIYWAFTVTYMYTKFKIPYIVFYTIPILKVKDQKF